jgi:hypothetical protein
LKKELKSNRPVYYGYVQGNPFSFPYYSNQYIGVIKTVASEYNYLFHPEIIILATLSKCWKPLKLLLLN